MVAAIPVAVADGFSVASIAVGEKAPSGRSQIRRFLTDTPLDAIARFMEGCRSLPMAPPAIMAAKDARALRPLHRARAEAAQSSPAALCANIPETPTPPEISEEGGEGNTS